MENIEETLSGISNKLDILIKNIEEIFSETSDKLDILIEKAKPVITYKSIPALADKVGVAHPYIWMILAGERRPSWDMAKKLETASNIPASEWMDNHSRLKGRVIRKGK